MRIIQGWSFVSWAHMRFWSGGLGFHLFFLEKSRTNVWERHWLTRDCKVVWMRSHGSFESCPIYSSSHVTHMTWVMSHTSTCYELYANRLHITNSTSSSILCVFQFINESFKSYNISVNLGESSTLHELSLFLYLLSVPIHKRVI